MSFQSLKDFMYSHTPFAFGKPKVKDLIYSDMVLHLPVIEWFASKCQHCTEFGVREGFSTISLIAGCSGEVVSYDIEQSPIVNVLRSQVLPCKSWNFIRANTIEPSLELAETDLLLFDTLHTYSQLSQEMLLHAHKSRRFLVFHDTETCGANDLSGPNPEERGILPAINEYMDKHKGYELVYETKMNNGLMVFELTNR